MNWPPLRDSKTDVSSVSPSSERIRRGANARNVSFRISLHNLVPKVLSLPRESTLVTAGHVSARF